MNGVIAKWTSAICVCLVAVEVACLGTIALAYVVHYARLAWRRWRGRGRVHAALIALAIAGAVYCGNPVKPKPLTVAWDEGYIGGTAYVPTNAANVAEFRWRVGVGVPATATADFFAVARSQFSADGTNTLFSIGSTTMGAGEFAAQMAGAATNYLYWAACGYIPPASMKTNGVYHVKCVGGVNSRLVPLGLELWADGVRVSPPAEGGAR